MKDSFQSPSDRKESFTASLRMDQLAAEYAATDPLGETGRRALFSELADLVDECLTVEKQAAGLLADMSG